MARALIGISNTSIHAVNRLLKQYYASKDEDCPKLVFFGFHTIPPADKLKNRIVLVPTIADMQAHHEVLTDAACVVIVWGPPVVLDYLTDVPKPDVQFKPNSFTYRFQELTADCIGKLVEDGLAHLNNVVVAAPEISVIPTMLHRAPGSIAGAILSYLYTMQDANLRMKIQHVVYTWLSSPASIDDLEATIYSVTGEPRKRPVALGRLIAFLETDDGKRSKDAMNHVREQKAADKTVASKAVAKKFNLSEYDVSYALKSSNNALRSGTIVDSKPLNEFFWERKASDRAKVRTKDKKEKTDE